MPDRPDPRLLHEIKAVNPWPHAVTRVRVFNGKRQLVEFFWKPGDAINKTVPTDPVVCDRIELTPILLGGRTS